MAEQEHLGSIIPGWSFGNQRAYDPLGYEMRGDRASPFRVN
jgi:hypothetical protein